MILAGQFTHAEVTGWLNWRGPEQSGVSRETGFPSEITEEGALWAAGFPGASTPVVANGKLYIMGYLGEGADLQEGVACFDAETGKKLWQHLFNDFISDIIYLRYAQSNPVIDPETGNVYMQGSQGILAGFTADGKLLWQKSLMEEIGRLTFPNGRTASPIIEGDLVIVRGITANWGAQGPGGDRFYAFDKSTGEPVWASNPADRPKDNSFSMPIVTTRDGKRVFYASTGDGSIVCVNARNGDPIWRVPLFRAGINATVLVHNNDKIIAIFGVPYEPGQLVAMKIPEVNPAPGAGPVVIEREKVELWSAEVTTSTSSPILADDTVYVVAEKGDLCAVDANTGVIKWKLKIGIEQRNACPLYADGKLYVPILDDPAGKGTGNANEAGTQGGFYVVKTGDKPEMLAHIALDGRCFGSPVAYNGKLYLQTTKKLYCWGGKGKSKGLPKPISPEAEPKAGLAAALQVIPSEVVLRPGQKTTFRARKVDANGFVVQEVADVSQLKWTSYIPSTAKVKSSMRASFNADGELVAASETVPSAGAFEATLDGLKGYIRGRVLPYLPLSQDFESFNLMETNAASGVAFAYPPLPWIGARFKFEVRERDGTKCLVKTIDNKFFQRATVFFGAPDASNYTIEADVLTEGNRRKKSEVGLICQRYAIVLKGNEQKLEVSSNFERLRESVDFNFEPNVWYHLKARVDVAEDGKGVVRAKAWKRGEPEPDVWTIEVKHNTAHVQGSPGLFGFSPQDMPVAVDNIKVTPN